MNEAIVQAIEELAENTSAGAVELSEQGADVLLRCARTYDSVTLDDFRHSVLEIGLRLIQSQPAMAPLVNLTNAALWGTSTASTIQESRERITEVVRHFKRQIRIHETAIAESALSLIHEQSYIITNSRSTTVRAALLHAQRSGRRFRVICAEGRPNFEGQNLAAELAEHGIDVTLVVDTLAIAYIPRASMVLIGADHLTSIGLANKVGTYAMSLVARDHEVPMYALCSSTKFLPPGYPTPSQDQRPSEQVWSQSPRNVRVENYYFDYTPLASLSGIVTERGVLPTEVVEGWLAAIQLHPDLKPTSLGARQTAVHPPTLR